jgi:hypothetical protein
MIGLEGPLFFLQSLGYELDQLFERCFVLLLVFAIGACWQIAAAPLLDNCKYDEGLGFDGLKICLVGEEGL